MQVSRDDGHVMCLDTRGGANAPPLFTLAAHDEAATSVLWSPASKDLMFTSSVDKTVRSWTTCTYLPECTWREATTVTLYSAGFGFLTDAWSKSTLQSGVLYVSCVISKVIFS